MNDFKIYKDELDCVMISKFDVKAFVKTKPSDIMYALQLESLYDVEIDSCEYTFDVFRYIGGRIEIDIGKTSIIKKDNLGIDNLIMHRISVEQFIGAAREVYPDLVSSIIFRLHLFR